MATRPVYRFTDRQVNEAASHCGDCVIWDPDNWLDVDAQRNRMSASGKYNEDEKGLVALYLLPSGMTTVVNGLEYPLHNEWVLCKEHEAMAKERA
jgi:hypothetical protein